MEALAPLLIDHLSRYPYMQVCDLYKLLHQAALGAGHAVQDEDAARGWLERELAEMGPGLDEPIFDPLSPDGDLVRLHLRPYLASGRDPQVLLRAFVRTANEWQGSWEMLLDYGRQAQEVLNSPPVVGPLTGEAFHAFLTAMQEQGFPAAHHSATYRVRYRPAYRVVARLFLEGG